MPRLLPYAVYRPLVRLAHYAGLRRALRSGASVVVHDCGTQAWVRALAGPRGPAPRPARCTWCCSTSPRTTALAGPARARPGRLAATPSPGTGGAVARLLARRGERAAARGLRARRCCSTGTPRTCCGGSASRTLRPDGSHGAESAGPPAPASLSAQHAVSGSEQAVGTMDFRRGGGWLDAADFPAPGDTAPASARRMARQRAGGGARRLARHARRPAAGSSRCSAAASSGCRCPNGGGPRQPPPRPAHHGDRGPGVRARSSAPRSSSCQVVGSHMSFTVAPAVEFARGLPPQLGIAVNPGRRGRRPAAAARRRRAVPGRAAPRWTARPPAAGSGSSSRTGRRTRSTSWPPPPAEFAGHRRGPHRPPLRWPASRAADPVLFVGVELSPAGRATAHAPDGRPRPGPGHGVRSPWPVNLVLLDVAQDPVGDWMLERVRPFYRARGTDRRRRDAGRSAGTGRRAKLVWRRPARSAVSARPGDGAGNGSREGRYPG